MDVSMYIRVFLLMIHLVQSRDETVIQFVKNFIENEQKPTDLVMNGLCWKKHNQMKLVSELSKIGVRSSNFMNVICKYQRHLVLHLIDLSCPGSEQILLDATERKLFASPFRWLALSNEESETSKEILFSRPLLPDSEVVLAEQAAEGFILTELHKPAINYSMISTSRGFYNGSLLDTRSHKSLYRRRRDLKGHYLTISNVIQDSNTTKYHLVQEDRLELQYDAVAKICWISATHAFEMLKATPRYIFSYRFGYKVKGKWSGMVHDLQLKKADLGTNCVVFIDRMEVVAYTDTVAPMRMRFVFRQPPLSYVSNIFSLPFSRNVWMAIAVCSLGCTGTFYFTSKWERTFGMNPTQLDGSIGDALLLTMSAVTQQGCYIEPRRIPGRIMEWVFFAVLMALYAAYSANIVVLLQAPSNSIKTLAELSNSKIHLAANDLDYNRFVLSPSQTLTDPIHQSIHDRIDNGNGKGEYYHIYEGVERMRKGLFAFHSIVEPVYHRVEKTFQETEKCDLTEVDFINSFDAATPVQKDSPYIELLRVVYKQLRESGILSVLNRRLQTPKPHCSNKLAAFSSVGLMDLKPVLLLMIYGILLSLGIMILEMTHYKIKNYHWEKSKLITK
ncbi:glutamate receptor-like [Achroia grisella]|uniref:glutamate receptor-like n=1 Tax=Achroia grisella TaxID=688607 RepID=UPI0027D29F3D|nr:glutamate receptor-like [Achroia grisella]